MTTHILHPDTHTGGLADGCPRCSEHAAYPFEGLDNENLASLVSRIEQGLYPRSDAERLAMDNIGKVMRAAKKLVQFRQEGGG